MPDDEQTNLIIPQTSSREGFSRTLDEPEPQVDPHPVSKEFYRSYMTIY